MLPDEENATGHSVCTACQSREDEVQVLRLSLELICLPISRMNVEIAHLRENLGLFHGDAIASKDGI